MIEVVALGVVVAVALFFIALGGAALIVPLSAKRFLLGFAGSPFKHYAELALRVLVGSAFVLAAPRMLLPAVFALYGWVLLLTTVALLLIPWRWHHRFAQRAVPEAIRFLPVVGVSSVLLGGLVLAAVYHGNAG